jgi:hypothetical protein
MLRLLSGRLYFESADAEVGVGGADSLYAPFKLFRDRNRRIEEGFVGLDGLRWSPFAAAEIVVVVPFWGVEPLVMVERGAGAVKTGAGFSAMGEGGGGGMSVPAVRDSRGARTGSSNFCADDADFAG